MISALSVVFLFGWVIRLFCARFAVQHLAVYTVLGSLIEQTSMATATGTSTMTVLSVRYNSFVLFTKTTT